MPTLLSLPQELRDQIYWLSMQSSWNADSTLRIIPRPASDGQHYYWVEHGKWRPIPLLSVNRQTRQEVLDCIENRHKNPEVPLEAEMDIRVRGYVCTPTWTYLNYALRERDELNLHVNLNISSTEAFKPNDGWPRQPGQIFRSLLNLLCRFIYNGPSFLDEKPPFKTPGPHFIRRLSVHVAFQDWYTPATWAETTHEIFRMLKVLSLLDTANKHIGSIRASTAYTYRGKDVSRQSEWKVCAPESAKFKESEWNRMGFVFGETWAMRNASTMVRQGSVDKADEESGP